MKFTIPITITHDIAEHEVLIAFDSDADALLCEEFIESGEFERALEAFKREHGDT